MSKIKKQMLSSVINLLNLNVVSIEFIVIKIKILLLKKILHPLFQHEIRSILSWQKTDEERRSMSDFHKLTRFISWEPVVKI